MPPDTGPEQEALDPPSMIERVEDLELTVTELTERVQRLFGVLRSASLLVQSALSPPGIDLRRTLSEAPRE